MIGGPWPERIGREGRTVEDELDPSIYPLKGRGDNEVVILLDHDPLRIPGAVPSDDCWSCVIGRKDVEAIPDLNMMPGPGETTMDLLEP